MHLLKVHETLPSSDLQSLYILLCFTLSSIFPVWKLLGMFPVLSFVILQWKALYSFITQEFYESLISQICPWYHKFVLEEISSITFLVIFCVLLLISFCDYISAFLGCFFKYLISLFKNLLFYFLSYFFHLIFNSFLDLFFAIYFYLSKSFIL